MTVDICTQLLAHRQTYCQSKENKVCTWPVLIGVSGDCLVSSSLAERERERERVYVCVCVCVSLCVCVCVCVCEATQIIVPSSFSSPKYPSP